VDVLVDSYEVPGRNEGIAEQHPRKDELIQRLEDMYQDDDEALKENLKTADRLLLAFEDDELLEIVMHGTWDVEDLDDNSQSSSFSDEEQVAVNDIRFQDLKPSAEASKISKRAAGKDVVVHTSKRVRHCDDCKRDLGNEITFDGGV
jgi:hypothetical protein